MRRNGFVVSHPSEARMGHPVLCWVKDAKNRSRSFDCAVRVADGSARDDNPKTYAQDGNAEE